MEEKLYILYAGVNGAGKSTLYQLQDIHLPRINTDEIVQQIGGDWRSTRDQMKAGKIAAKQLHEYIKQGVSFNQETTLGGRSMKNTILKAKEQGYQIHMHYVGLDSADTAIERVKNRVQEGGHGIPEEDIRRRYEVSLKNLREVIPLLDKVRLYDNTKVFAPIANINGHIELMSNYKNAEWAKEVLQDRIVEQMKQDIIRSGFRPTDKIINHMCNLQEQRLDIPTVKEIKDFYKNRDYIKMTADARKEVDDIAKEFIKQQRMHFPER